MWSTRKRVIWPGYATPEEAVRYLASACDGAIRRDGHGFSSHHVSYGHWLASLADNDWRQADHRAAAHLVRIYRCQLARAGFDPNQILHNQRPPRISARIAARLRPQWAADPTGLHQWRWWNGARWTSHHR